MATGDIKGFKEVSGPVFTEQVLNATGAEIDTGTELSRFATPKAIADSKIAKKDANGNLTVVNLMEGYSTAATSGGNTTLTIASNFLQFFTGSSAQTLIMPVTSTLVLGMQWLIVNNSSGAVTVNSSGSNAIVIVPGGCQALLTCILVTGTSAASWNAQLQGISVATGKKLTVSNSLTLQATDGSTLAIGTGGTLGAGAYAAKASNAEIDTGTEDTKFVSAKGIRDSGLLSGAVSGEIAGLTDKATPADADVIMAEDSAASNAKKKLSWTNIKTTLKTYFDTLYMTLAGGTLTGNLTLGENTSVDLDPVLSADGKYTGICRTGTAGATLAFGNLVYLDPTDSRWELADANIAAGADGDPRGILGMCVLAAAGDGSATKILLSGVIRADAAFPAMTINAPMYVGETSGAIVVTQPSTADVVIRVVGFALTADELYFNPSNDYITHT